MIKFNQVCRRQQVRLLCPWAQHLTRCFYFWVVRQSAGGSLTWRPKRSPMSLALQ